ncbi:ImmA/IrrE family metallo-endopeptidase [Bacillus cereus]|uniref:Phage related protein n=1 Tax=Lysobacter enzymogenes TaxID=69 RepID=A0AAU9AIJ0_LYSEN|nr:ImmA/IrrE family metallo-endopeptidase [Lysobacter enzymogenes]BAV96648.1 phage related protein [Lysobacter enzymogenes]
MAVVKRRPAPAVVAVELKSLDQVRHLMAESGLGGVPVDVASVAALLGMHLQYEQMSEEMSGYLENRAGRWVIGVNSLHAGVRQRFTIAHEVAHYVLHRDQQGSFRDVIFMRRSMNANAMEKQADRFAAELLMPESQVVSDIRGGLLNVHALAARYNVSALAMKYRLQNLGYAVS